MSDEEEIGVYSSSNTSSDTLILDDADGHSITSTSSSTSSTTLCWIPGGLPGRLLHALGPSTVDLVTRFRIKKRLSSISSDVDIHLRTKTSLSEDETEQFGLAYRVLVELSSSSYCAAISSQAINLRLSILRAIILSERSCFCSYWEKYTFRKTWAELDKLALYVITMPIKKWLFTMLPRCPQDSTVRNAAAELRDMLMTKAADELSSRRTRLHAIGTLLEGTNIVAILCHDLAYGTGGYAVQSALDHLSCTSWGTSQLRALNREGDLVLNAARRLLIGFDNVFSKGMAYRIFGEIAAEHKTRKLGRLLSGVHGVGSLIERFDLLIQPTEHSYYVRLGRQCIRSMEALCAAIMSACCHGFIQEVVEQGLCPYLIALVEIFVERDNRVQKYIEDDETEDPDVERDQIAACKLVLKLLQDDNARNVMLECGLTKVIRQFGSSFNREMSEWYLRVLINDIKQKLD